jgi:F0F1-type ATP synthase assembly protein I
VVGPDWRLMAFQLGQLGFAVAFCLVGGLLGGLWVDRSLGTSPLFILVGSLLGIAIASLLAYRTIAEAIALAEEKIVKPKAKNQSLLNEDKDSEEAG